MNLTHLYYFRKLIEVGSYTHAAEELYITQPTLSLAVSNLESELGCALIKKRRSPKLELTQDGEDFYQAVIVACNALDNVTRTIKERAANENAMLSIGMVYSIQNSEWSEAIRKYQESTSQYVHVTWKQGTTIGLMKDLRDGSLDAIMAGVLEKRDPGIISIPASSQPACLLVNVANPLAKRTRISLDELVGMPIITYQNKRGAFIREIAALVGKRKNLDISYDYSDEITLASLVAANPRTVAIACHSWLIEAFHDVVPITIDEAPADFHRFYVSYRKQERLSPALQGFVDFMKDYDFDAKRENNGKSGKEPCASPADFL